MNTTHKMLDIIRSNPRFEKANASYVSIYALSDAYGGPEEGGWWKRYWKLEGSVWFPTEEQALAFVDEATKLASNMRIEALRNQRDVFVANHREGIDYEDDFCGGEVPFADDFEVIIEDKPGSLDNTHEPIGHWE